MNYSKKVVVIKQTENGFSQISRPANGIARLECENGVCDFHLTVINLNAVIVGEFFVFIIDGLGELYSFPLGKRPLSFSQTLLPCPDISKGFSVGLCYIKDNLPVVFCFGKTDDCPIDYYALKKRVAEKCLSQFKAELKQREEMEQEQEQAICVPTLPPESLYDDEAVATENYFETEEKIKVNLERIKEYSRERIFDEDELPFSGNAQKEIESQKNTCCPKNETNFNSCQVKQAEYYLTVKEELQTLFDKFDSHKELCSLFPESNWAKINYSKDRFYVVGLIKENGYEKYICYGVPHDNPQKPPKQLEGFCSFVPINNCSDYKGFWMMFQDANNGKCVKSIN